MVEKIKAQEWLEKNYKKEETEISFILFKVNNEKNEENDIELEGELLVDDYSDLKTIDLSEAKGITKLTIKDCPNIEVINIYDNPITEIVGLGSLTKLRDLNFGNTEIREIDISKSTRLESLSLQKNGQEVKINGFENIIKKLNYWNSIETMTFPGEKITEGDLKGIAKDLGIKDEDIKDKSVEQMKGLIKEKIERLQEIKDKVGEIPGLLDKDKDKIDTDKLDELKGLKSDEIKKLEEGLKELGIEKMADAVEEIKKLRKREGYIKLLENNISKNIGNLEKIKTSAQIEQVEIRR